MELAPKKLSPFDFVKSVTETKERIDLVENEKEYTAFVINKALSFNPDCLFMVQEMNQYPDIPKDAQYEFYLNGLAKKRRYGRWVKKDSFPSDLELVKEVYGYSNEKAITALNILSEKQLVQLKTLMNKGGRS